MNTKHRLPVKFHKMRSSFLIDESERVNTKAFHHTIASWYSSITHKPEYHMHCLRRSSYEIPKIIVGTSSLWNLITWFWLYSMHYIREFHCIMNKERCHII